VRKGLSRGERVRIKTPWGMWRCAGGLEVLFNLQRWPILQRYPGGQTTGCDPNKSVEFECEAFFFAGLLDAPWSKDGSAARQQIAKVFEDWDVPAFTDAQWHEAAVDGWRAFRTSTKTPTTTGWRRIDLWSGTLRRRAREQNMLARRLAAGPRRRRKRLAGILQSLGNEDNF
jgi:hypothetical protein